MKRTFLQKKGIKMILKNKIKITGMEKLKPCPFCGYDAEVRMLKYSTGFYNYEIYCPH